jgi:hypothetical protein
MVYEEWYDLFGVGVCVIGTPRNSGRKGESRRW